MKQKNSKSNCLRDEFFQFDVNEKYRQQDGKCIHKYCKKINGKHPPPLYLDFEKDHILAPKLYRAWRVKGDPNGIENLQLLDPNAHYLKTMEDTKLIALFERNKGTPGVKGKIKGCIMRYTDLTKTRECTLKILEDAKRKKQN